MRRNFLLLTIATALLSLSSCKKVWDYVKDHPNGTADNCRIDKIYFTENYLTDIDATEPFLFRDTADFKYNTKGQLTSIDYVSGQKHLTVDIYPPNNMLFTYDDKGRLRSFYRNAAKVPGYSVVSTLFINKYTYLDDNTIIDSSFVYAQVNIDQNDELVYGSNNPYYNSIITLDSYNRIAKVEYPYIDSVEYYNYDSRGNLIKPGLTYTNKTSIFQTDKVFMFVNRDYSINTPSGYANKFNSNGLPVKFNSGYLPFFTNGSIIPVTWYYSNQDIIVEYQCR